MSLFYSLYISRPGSKGSRDRLQSGDRRLGNAVLEGAQCSSGGSEHADLLLDAPVSISDLQWLPGAVGGLL